MSSLDRAFSAEDLETLRAATAGAEEGTSGEVVPYIVERCDVYSEASWKAAVLGALLAALAAGTAHHLGGFWGGWGLVWIGLPPLAGAALGYLLPAAFPALRRRLIPREVLELRAERRAAAAFVEEEVFATRERTGILIFLALFERQVVILADAGIHARVEEVEWQGIAGRLAAGIRRGRAAAALVRAIGECGELLARRGVERRADDFDELPDEPRLRRE